MNCLDNVFIVLFIIDKAEYVSTATLLVSLAVSNGRDTDG